MVLISLVERGTEKLLRLLAAPDWLCVLEKTVVGMFGQYSEGPNELVIEAGRQLVLLVGSEQCEMEMRAQRLALIGWLHGMVILLEKLPAFELFHEMVTLSEK